MINLQHLFQDFFADDGFSLTELVGTGGDWVGRMTVTNPGAVFTPRINALAAALAAVESNTTDAGVKLALQKSATANKKNFRTALVGNMAKVQAKVVAQYGKEGVELLEIFPKGLAPFAVNAKEEPLENELGVVAAGLTAHVADLGAPVVSEVGGYLSAWLVVYNASKGSKDVKKSSNLTGGDLRKTLQLEMTKTALFVACTYPGDTVKGAYYLPTEKLFNPQAHPPGACTIEVSGGAGSITTTGHASGATLVRWFRRLAGETIWVEMGNGPADEEVTFDTLAAGNYEVKARGENDEGPGSDSAVSTVTVT